MAAGFELVCVRGEREGRDGGTEGREGVGMCMVKAKDIRKARGPACASI